MITYYVTGQHTTTAINLGINLHGMTRSKDLVETLHKSGVCISYADAFLLHDYWALKDLDVSGTSPLEIADNKPVIAIVDNDDLKIDTLTGNAAGAHRTNVMFVPPVNYEKKSLEDPVPGDTKKKEVTSQHRQKCAELTVLSIPMSPG